MLAGRTLPHQISFPGNMRLGPGESLLLPALMHWENVACFSGFTILCFRLCGKSFLGLGGWYVYVVSKDLHRAREMSSLRIIFKIQCLLLDYRRCFASTRSSCFTGPPTQHVRDPPDEAKNTWTTHHTHLPEYAFKTSHTVEDVTESWGAILLQKYISALYWDYFYYLD